MSDYCIQLDHVNYSYKKNDQVLKDVNLRVPKGSIYGFIGPNGSGKSTTMGLLTDLIPNDADNIYLFDEKTNEYLPMGFNKIGSLIESPSLYLHMTGAQNLKYICTIRSINTDIIDDTLEKVGILDAKNKKVKNYSLGMKQRLAIAITLLHQPDLLLLDEPVNGLDPNGMIEIRELLVKLNKEDGVTIFISSHLLDEIEKMCTHIGIISKGSIVFQGTRKELNAQLKSDIVLVQIPNANQYQMELEKAPFKPVEILTNEMKFSIDNEDDIPKIVNMLSDMKIPIYGVSKKENLENQFLQLTQN